MTPEDFLQHLWRLSDRHKRVARKYSPGKVFLYRTRVFSNLETPKNVQDLSYPPIHKTKINRANDNGEQVFYASAGMPTTLAESRVKEGQYIIVSKWKNSKDLLLQEVGIAENPEGIEKIYHDIFTSADESIYPYSSKVAKHLMKGIPGFGLLYPSIINKNKSHNIVLSKKFVDEGLICVNASLYEVQSIYNDSKFKLDELDFAVAIQDKLEWKGRKKKWIITPELGELIMKSTGLDWEAYTKDGQYIEPE